jgi:hypothetical protein
LHRVVPHCVRVMARPQTARSVCTSRSANCSSMIERIAYRIAGTETSVLRTKPRLHCPSTRGTPRQAPWQARHWRPDSDAARK